MPLKETNWWLAKNKESQHKNSFCKYFSNLLCFVMPHRVIKFGLVMFCELVSHFIKTQLSFAFFLFLIWKFLLIVFLVSHNQQVSLSCGAKCYFSKLGYQLLLVLCFWKKTENYKISIFCHSWCLKCRTFLRMALKYVWLLTYTRC